MAAAPLGRLPWLSSEVCQEGVRALFGMGCSRRKSLLATLLVLMAAGS